MKPFLGINITTNSKNENENGKVFMTTQPSLALSQAFERSAENADIILEKSKFPLPIRILHFAAGICGTLISMGILKAFIGEDAVSLSHAYQNVPWLFWLGGFCLFLWVILKLLAMHKERKVLQAEGNEQSFITLEATQQAIFHELDVPPTANEVDILSFYYKEKGDHIKICEKGSQLAPYMTNIFHVSSDTNNLNLTNLDGKYSFPLSSIRGIKTVKKTIRIDEWNKDEPYNKGIYKPYKLSEDNWGCIICKGYHIIEIDRDGELWGIYIPRYELPVFEALTGLTAYDD